MLPQIVKRVSESFATLYEDIAKANPEWTYEQITNEIVRKVRDGGDGATITGHLTSSQSSPRMTDSPSPQEPEVVSKNDMPQDFDCMYGLHAMKEGYFENGDLTKWKIDFQEEVATCEPKSRDNNLSQKDLTFLCKLCPIYRINQSQSPEFKAKMNVWEAKKQRMEVIARTRAEQIRALPASEGHINRGASWQDIDRAAWRGNKSDNW